MFARVSRYQGMPDKAEEIARWPVPREVLELSGYKGVYALLDRKSGKVMTITLWETEKAMQDSVEVAKRVRAEFAKTAGATEPPSVETYEIVQQP